ncbi:MAG TPA: hypothetical protein VJJ23_05885 [Candidatus Nanoarchaeia archaeon]|nr:hypothetical protein [Candidatus Nanoarchaeia archaeon]
MEQKKPKEDNSLRDLLKETNNEDSGKLVNYIQGKLNVSEFKIAEKLGLSVNQVRNMLYKLHEYNLVSSVRKKDKKKGWYVYYWSFNNNEARIVLKNIKKTILENLRKKLETEQIANYFVCPNGDIKLSFEEALEYNFKCFECGKLLVQEDNKKDIANIKKRILELEQDLGVSSSS